MEDQRSQEGKITLLRILWFFIVLSVLMIVVIPGFIVCLTDKKNHNDNYIQGLQTEYDYLIAVDWQTKQLLGAFQSMEVILTAAVSAGNLSEPEADLIISAFLKQIYIHTERVYNYFYNLTEYDELNTTAVRANVTLHNYNNSAILRTWRYTNSYALANATWGNDNLTVPFYFEFPLGRTIEGLINKLNEDCVTPLEGGLITLSVFSAIYGIATTVLGLIHAEVKESESRKKGFRTRSKIFLGIICIILVVLCIFFAFEAKTLCDIPLK